MKLVCIFSLSLVLNSTYGQGFGSVEEAGFSSASSNATNELEPISAMWADFQTRHIVSSVQGSAANWNAYFRQKMPSQFGNKGVNTFVVNSASVISRNFPTGVPQYTGGSANNLYWSSTKQHIFVLTLIGQPGQPHPNYNVYDCGQKYFVAGLDMSSRLPVHYQGHSSTQGPKIDPITAGCAKVTRHDFFYQLNETSNDKDTMCTSVILSGALVGLVMFVIVSFELLLYFVRNVEAMV